MSLGLAVYGLGSFITASSPIEVLLVSRAIEGKRYNAGTNSHGITRGHNTLQGFGESHERL